MVRLATWLGVPVTYFTDRFEPAEEIAFAFRAIQNNPKQLAEFEAQAARWLTLFVGPDATAPGRNAQPRIATYRLWASRERATSVRATRRQFCGSASDALRRGRATLTSHEPPQTLPPRFSREFANRLRVALEDGTLSCRRACGILDLESLELEGVFHSYGMAFPYEA